MNCLLHRPSPGNGDVEDRLPPILMHLLPFFTDMLSNLLLSDEAWRKSLEQTSMTLA